MIRKTWEIREHDGVRFFEVVSREYSGDDTPEEGWWPDHDADVILPFVSSPLDPPLSENQRGECPSCGGVVGRTVDWFKLQAYCSIRDG